MPQSASKDQKAAGLGKWTPFVLVGAGVVAIIAIAGGNRASSSGNLDASGLVAEQAAQLVQAEAEKRAAGEDAASAALAQAREQLNASIKMSEARTLAAIEKAAATNAQASPPWADLLQAIKDLIAKQGASNPAPAAPAAPLGPRPSDSEIRDWAKGINLPVEWAFALVGKYGILPRNIPELEKWRAEIGYQTPGGGWCVAGVCI